MPLYDYHCDTCGDFRALRQMAESGASGSCPACGGASERVLSAPFVGGKDAGGMAAARVRGAGPASWRGACGLGCTHAHGQGQGHGHGH